MCDEKITIICDCVECAHNCGLLAFNACALETIHIGQGGNCRDIKVKETDGK